MTLTSPAPTATASKAPAPVSRRERRHANRLQEDREDNLPVGYGTRRRGNLLVLVGLGVLTLYAVLPVWWLIVSSTKSQRDLYSSNALWFSNPNFIDNVKQVFTYQNGIFVRWLGNSLLYAAVGGIVCTVISLGVGYSISKFEFPGRGAGMAAIIGSFLIPSAMLTLPLYLLMAKVGLVDSVWSVLIPTFISPFGAYLAKVYIDGAIPDEVLEAARIDGAGELRIFFTIVIRLMVTGAATIFTLTFVNTWNGFYLPLTMLRSSSKWSLTLGLYSMLQKRLDSSVDLTALVLCGALLSTIPLVIFMIAMQRYWKAGVTVGAVK